MASSRGQVLDGALALLRSEGTVSLDSVARSVGMTKAGVMHYFGTKQALMLALVDHVAEQWERELTSRLPAAGASARDRMRAYLDWSLSGSFDESDLVMIADPRLRRSLTAHWRRWMETWLALPGELPDDERTRLTAVRLLADGAWIADAAGVGPLSAAERERVRALAGRLLDDDTTFRA